jgi:hypothetical protein
MFIILRLLLLALAPQFAQAYPEFIGYGYSTCLTCHYNGHGNGPLNDYGRALMAAEISSRQWTGDKTEDELSASSTFLGIQTLPWWLKPGIKTRTLMYQPNPGSPSAKTETIFMQADVNAAVLLDKKATKAFVGSFGYAPKPQSASSRPGDKTIYTWISREHYVRWNATKPLWVYAGFMDKVYGIRIINHTAYSRAMTGLAQNDQSHGMILHYIQPTWEVTLNAFMGNMFQDADLRQKGASVSYEYELMKDWRIGTSALSSSNDYVKNERAGVFSRFGLSNGSSWLLDTGLIRNTPKTLEPITGYYLYTQVTQKLVRGYHLFMAAQAYKQEMKSAKNDQTKFELGMMAFVYPGVEIRIEGENNRTISSTSVTKEGWTALAQLHLSL